MTYSPDTIWLCEKIPIGEILFFKCSIYKYCSLGGQLLPHNLDLLKIVRLRSADSLDVGDEGAINATVLPFQQAFPRKFYTAFSKN